MDFNEDIYSKIINKFWTPNVNVMDKIKTHCISNNFDKIVELGPGYKPFELSNYVIDIDDSYSELYSEKIFLKTNINYETIPRENKFFDYCYSRHTLEDISTPFFAFNELTRVSKRGFIETPSPLIEMMKGVDAGETTYRGYIHHRYIVWSDTDTNTIYFLPKMPIIERIVLTEDLNRQMHYTANTQPLLWNNYYIWDENMTPNIIVYGYNSDYDYVGNYAELLNEGLNKSIEYTKTFFGDCY